MDNNGSNVATAEVDEVVGNLNEVELPTEVKEAIAPAKLNSKAILYANAFVEAAKDHPEHTVSFEKALQIVRAVDPDAIKEVEGAEVIDRSRASWPAYYARHTLHLNVKTLHGRPAAWQLLDVNGPQLSPTAQKVEDDLNDTDEL